MSVLESGTGSEEETQNIHCSFADFSQLHDWNWSAGGFVLSREVKGSVLYSEEVHPLVESVVHSHCHRREMYHPAQGQAFGKFLEEPRGANHGAVLRMAFPVVQMCSYKIEVSIGIHKRIQKYRKDMGEDGFLLLMLR